MKKLSVVLSMLCLLPLLAMGGGQWQVGNRNFAPPASVVSVAFNNGNTPATGLSNSFTVNSGSNVCAFAIISDDADFGNYSSGTTAVTYGGVSMTKVGRATGTDSYSDAGAVDVWWLGNPPTGSNTLVLTSPAGYEVVVNMVSFTGANTSTCVRSGSYVSATSTSQVKTTGNHTVTSSLGDLTLSAVVTIGSAGTVTQTGNTLDGSAFDSDGYYGFASDHSTVSATSVTHDFSWPGGSNSTAAWVWLGLCVQHL